MMPCLARALAAIQHPVTEWRVQRAKAAHRKREPACRLCRIQPSFLGRSNDVHHRIPVHVDPSRACDDDNLVTLCRIHHFRVGHLGSWRDWNGSLDRMIVDLRAYVGQVRFEDVFSAGRFIGRRGALPAREP